MARYVEDIQFRKYAFIEEGDDSVSENIELALDSAEAEVDNDLDCAALSDYEDANGNLPAPLIKAILIKALQGYDSPDGMRSSSLTYTWQYEKCIKPYVKLVKP